MSFQSPLGRVRGLGSTQQGSHHFWIQRLTAVALIPLIIWFAFAAVPMVGADHAAFTTWVGTHYNGVLLGLLVAAAYHHGQLGLQVVIEDYIHAEGTKIALIIAVKMISLLLAVTTIYAILRLTFGS